MNHKAKTDLLTGESFNHSNKMAKKSNEGQTPNDQRADVKNPNNEAFKVAADNKSVQKDTNSTPKK